MLRMTPQLYSAEQWGLKWAQKMASLNSFKHGSFLGLLWSIILISCHGAFCFLSLPVVQNLASTEDATVATDG